MISRSWVVATTAVFAIVGGVLGYLAWRLSGGSFVVASLVVMCALFSRFAGFFVLQAFGMMESVALLWLLVTLVVTLIAWERRSSAILATSSIPFALSAFAHERYVVLVGFVLTVALLAPWTMSRRRRAILAGLPLLVVLLDYAVKQWFVSVSFLQGGGGGNSTNLADSLAFFVGGAINTLGFNAGDPIWAGHNSLHDLGPALVVMALFALPVIVLAVRTVVERGTIPDFPRKVVIAASLYGPLLVSASIQSRQEWRWLVGPFVVVLLGVAWSAKWLPKRSAVALVPIVALLGSLAVDAYYRPGQEDNYYHVAQRTADNIYDTVVADHAGRDSYSPESSW